VYQGLSRDHTCLKAPWISTENEKFKVNGPSDSSTEKNNNNEREW
jgi:hypothetical protein